jgi:hypothetical protein
LLVLSSLVLGVIIGVIICVTAAVAAEGAKIIATSPIALLVFAAALA